MRRSRWWLRHREWRLAAAARSACTLREFRRRLRPISAWGETGVGLIPGGGGSKEMLIRANERAASGEDLDLFHALRPIFETVAMAKVGTSAEESRELGFLRREDGVSMNRDRLVA